MGGGITMTPPGVEVRLEYPVKLIPNLKEMTYKILLTNK